MTTLEKIRALLAGNNFEFREIHHEPTHTSEASARARGEDVKIGGKALVMKIGEEYKLFVLSAALKLNSRKLKEHFGIKRMRFADRSELLQLTGLVPGAVPPFGRPILDLDLYVDRSITQNARIAFNAGSLTDSIIMRTADYLKITNPTIIDFSGE